MNALPEHVEQTLSEAGDSPLTASARAELDRVCAQYPEAAIELRRYERLSSLIRGWRVVPTTVNYAEARERLNEVLTSGGQESAALDESLREFRKLPEVDWRGFHHRVAQAVRRDATTSTIAPRGERRRSRWRLIAGVGTPLAAAAAIFIAVLWQNPEVTLPDATPAIKSSIAVQLAMPSNSGRVVFRFDQSARANDPASSIEELSGSAIAIGPGTQSTPEIPESALLF